MTAGIPTGVSCGVVLVTPDMAEKMLVRNPSNRRLRPAIVSRIARDMKSGRWVFNGESVQMTREGVLINGQHRLTAVVESGVTCPMLVVRGLPPEAQDTIDTGSPRALADSLTIKGERNAATLAAIIRRVVMWDNGIRTNTGKFVPSESEGRTYLDQNPTLRQVAETTVRSRRILHVPGSTFGLAYWLAFRYDEDAPAFFVDQLTDGVGLAAGMPAHTLRRRIEDERTRRGRVLETDLLGFILSAWNAHAAERSLSRLQTPEGGWTAANLPDVA